MAESHAAAAGSADGLSAVEQRALAAVDAVADEMIAFTRDLVRLPTVNPPGEQYAACADLVATRLHELGYAVEILHATGLPEHSARYPRVNVVGRLAPPAASGKATHGPPDRQRVLHFNGHYDVVPPGAGWSVDPFGGEIRDGRLFGRGTCDQKAGIAASIYAVEALRRAGIALAGTVEQSATADEESGGFAGVAWLCDVGRLRADLQDYVVITEPLDPERVCVGHRGVYWFELTTLGAVGHGSMPGLAVNAAEQMSRFIQAVDTRLRPSLSARVTAQPVEPEGARRPSINLNAIRAGQDFDGWQTPCVPDRCIATFDRRFLAEERFEDVRAEIIALLDGLRAADPRFRYELRDLMRVDPVIGDPDSVLARTTAGAIRSALGASPTFIHSPGTYDHKHVLRRAGITECIAYGPGRLTLAHQPDEYVALDDLLRSAKVMALLAIRLLGTEKDAASGP